MNLHSVAQRIGDPYTRKPPTHSDAKVAHIAASKFGFDKPILVATKSGSIAGHEAAAGSRRFRG